MSVADSPTAVRLVRTRVDPVHAVPERRHVRGEREPTPPAVHRRPGPGPLHGNRIADVVDRAGPERGEAAELELDVRHQWPRVRVEHHERRHVRFLLDGDPPRQCLHRPVERLARERHGVPELVPAVLVGRLDGRAAERVVELVEQHQLPRPLEVGDRVVHVGEHRRDRRPLLRPGKEVLRAPVPPLHPGVRRVTADRVVLQLAGVHRDLLAGLGQPVEERPRRAAPQPGQPTGRIEPADAVQVGLRRPAAVVAHAVEHHQLRRVGRQLGERLVDLVPEIAAGAAVLVRDPVGQDPRAVRRLPPEVRAGQRHLVRAGAHEDVGVHTGLAQDLRQGRVVPERVHVAADGRRDAEAVLEVPLRVQRLADERLTARQVAVRLDPPAADLLPAPVRDPLADLREQVRVVFLDPRQVQHRVAGEHELGVLGHPVDRGREGGPHLLVALRPLPQPHRVDVRVADHVQQTLFRHVVPFSSRPLPMRRPAR